VAEAEKFALKIIRPPLAAPENEMTIRFGDKLSPWATTDGQEMVTLG